MAIRFDRNEAARVLQEAAEAFHTDDIDRVWLGYVDHLSLLCLNGAATHIAFLGTAILARSLSNEVDLFSIKPTHPRATPGAFSARTLCHALLVPAAAQFGFSLGVTGREPLNNQPYFRIGRIGDDTPINQNARQAFDYLQLLLGKLQGMKSTTQARKALRAFIAVRRRYQRRYENAAGEIRIDPASLSQRIADLVATDSEGGRVAQAAAAGLFDIAFGAERVESGRINDPSRHYPGDVAVMDADHTSAWKAIEVRDKAVSISDIKIFGKKCVDMGVFDAAVLMVDPIQEPIDLTTLNNWSTQFGLLMRVFIGWPQLAQDACFWSGTPAHDAAAAAVVQIRKRLIRVEASAAAVVKWDTLTRI